MDASQVEEWSLVNWRWLEVLVAIFGFVKLKVGARHYEVSQYPKHDPLSDIIPASSSTDPAMPGALQGSH